MEWLDYPLKSLRIYLYRLFGWINRRVLLTYPSNYECARCEDCGRTVHDYTAGEELWNYVYGSSSGVLCYDCFFERARRKGIYPWMHCHLTKKMKDKIRNRL